MAYILTSPFFNLFTSKYTCKYIVLCLMFSKLPPETDQLTLTLYLMDKWKWINERWSLTRAVLYCKCGKCAKSNTCVKLAAYEHFFSEEGRSVALVSYYKWSDTDDLTNWSHSCRHQTEQQWLVSAQMVQVWWCCSLIRFRLEMVTTLLVAIICATWFAG